MTLIGDFDVYYNPSAWNGQPQWSVDLDSAVDSAGNAVIVETSSRADAVYTMERFIADAQLALAKLRKLPEDTA